MSKSKIYSGIDSIPSGNIQGDIQEGCLVIEGGAFRGLYTQGVLDALLMNNINIHTVVGVSAGTLAGLTYVNGKLGVAAKVNLKYRHNSDYVGLKAFLHSKSVLNLDFLLQCEEAKEAFDIKQLKNSQRHFVAIATNCETGEAEFFDVDNCKDFYSAIKASASMPYSSRIVTVDGKKCLDGCCSYNLAYEWAIEKGFDKIIVLKTREREFRKTGKGSPFAKILYHKYPTFADKVIGRIQKYNQECDDVDRLEKEGRLFVLAPSTKVLVGRMESDVEKLGELYWQGYHDTLARLEDLKTYLSK